MTEKKNVNINLDVEDIVTKEVKADSNKGGKVYLHKDLVGKKVIVMSLRNGNGTKRNKTNDSRCEKCGKVEAINVIHYQRRGMLLNDELCMCDKKNLCSWGFFKKKIFKNDKRVQKALEKYDKKILK